MNIFLYIIGLIFLCFVMNYFSNILGDNLENVANKLKISPTVRGALFDGVSSSMPELLTSVVAAMAVLGVFSTPDPEAFADVGIGTIGGSAIFNILIIPFLSILVLPKHEIEKIEIDKKGMARDMIVYIIALLILGYGAYVGAITYKLGIVMTIVYILYVFLLIKKGNSKDFEPKEVEGPLWKYVVISLLSIIPIGVAVHFSVEFASGISEALKIPRLILALVVLAATTSIPDTLLSIRSAKKRELDASISNAVGSNIFDILVCLGTVLMFSGLTVKVKFDEVIYIFVFLVIAALGYTIAMLIQGKKNLKLALLGVPYVAFIIYLVTLVK